MERKIQSILLTLITAIIVGCFGFLWSLNAKMAVIQDHDTSRTEAIQEVKNTVQGLQNDMISVKQSLNDQKIERADDRRQPRR